jgi:hypothetical protein
VSASPAKLPCIRNQSSNRPGSNVAQEYRLEVLPAVKDTLDQNSVGGENECNRDAPLETDGA